MGEINSHLENGFGSYMLDLSSARFPELLPDLEGRMGVVGRAQREAATILRTLPSPPLPSPSSFTSVSILLWVREGPVTEGC